MSMKIIMILSSVIFCNIISAQTTNKIIGKWQAETKTLTSMNLDTYQFDNKGFFIFSPNGYNGLNRIISICGNFSIKGDTIYFIPKFTNEISGGDIIRSESTTLSDTWEIINGKSIKKYGLKKIKQAANIKIYSDSNYFILDERKYFKVD
jgi:hypothetical protein